MQCAKKRACKCLATYACAFATAARDTFIYMAAYAVLISLDHSSG